MEKQYPMVCSSGSVPVLLVLLVSSVFSADSVVAQNTVIAAVRDRQPIDELMIVDCMLPGQVRQLGTGLTYLAPRQATKSTASDCAIRGGEYVAYDRSNMGTSLNVWLPAAQSGDKVAQTYVGEIFEKGAGSTPDYASAAAWYKKAADQGYARALIDLGFLYEKGLGVAKDVAAALNLYRKAAGIEGSISLGGAGGASQQDVDALRKELESTRKELENARRELDRERVKSSADIERLTKQKVSAAAAGNSAETDRLEGMVKAREIELEKRRQQVAKLEQSSAEYKTLLGRLEWESASLRLDLQSARQELVASQREMDAKKEMLKATERTLLTTQEEVAAARVNKQSAGGAQVKVLEFELQKRDQALANQRMEMAELESNFKKNQEKVATLEASATPPPSAGAAAPAISSSDKIAAVTALRGLQQGKYYALIIGNQRYQNLGSLSTPEEDAKAVSDLLRKRYGFTVKTVLNATRQRMLTELNELRMTLTEKDSLLIYYAGHGEMDRATSLANWLPVDAEPNSQTNWISSAAITEILNAMSAKHVLVIADSCYSAGLTRSSIVQLGTGLSAEARIEGLRSLAQARSRTVLTSGGVSPVMDGGDGKHSVFTSKFIDVMSANQDVLEGIRLYREISAQVANPTARRDSDQKPEYAPIRFAGSETGDFIFIPATEPSVVRDDPTIGTTKSSQLSIRTNSGTL